MCDFQQLRTSPQFRAMTNTHNFSKLSNLPLLELLHVQESVAILSGQLKLGWQREHGLVEVSEHSLHCGSVLMTVVDVIIQTDELPNDENAGDTARFNINGVRKKKKERSMQSPPHLGFFLMSSNWPTTWDTFVRTILKAISSSPMISNLSNKKSF